MPAVNSPAPGVVMYRSLTHPPFSSLSQREYRPSEQREIGRETRSRSQQAQPQAQLVGRTTDLSLGGVEGVPVGVPGLMRGLVGVGLLLLRIRWV
jgi:hypothetical protein